MITMNYKRQYCNYHHCHYHHHHHRHHSYNCHYDLHCYHSCYPNLQIKAWLGKLEEQGKDNQVDPMRITMLMVGCILPKKTKTKKARQTFVDKSWSGTNELLPQPVYKVVCRKVKNPDLGQVPIQLEYHLINLAA